MEKTQRSTNPKRNQIHQNSSNLTTLALLLLLQKPSLTLSVVTPDWGAEKFSQFLFHSITIIQFICLIFMSIGSFLKNRPLNFFTGYKMISFSFFFPTCYLIGSEFLNAFRGMNDTFFFIWYKWMVTGYFGENYDIGIFSDLKDPDGHKKYFGWVNFVNSCFFEIVVILILRLISLIFSVRKSNYSKILTNFSKIFTLSLGPRVFVRAWLWVKQENNVSIANKTGSAWVRKWLQYLITWVIWAICLIVFLEAVINLIINGVKFIKKRENKGNKKPHLYQENNESSQDYGFRHGPKAPKDTVKTRNEEIRESVDMGLIDPKKKRSLVGSLFMPLWYIRWMLFTILAIFLQKWPKTAYSICSIVDFLMILQAVFSLKSLWGGLGVLYLIEEILIFLVHFLQLFLWIDYYKGTYIGDGKMGENGTKVLVFVIFFSSILSLILEFSAWIVGILVGTMKDELKMKVDLGTEDLEFEVANSGTELNNKISVYNTIKSDGVSLSEVGKGKGKKKGITKNNL